MRRMEWNDGWIKPPREEWEDIELEFQDLDKNKKGYLRDLMDVYRRLLVAVKADTIPKPQIGDLGPLEDWYISRILYMLDEFKDD